MKGQESVRICYQYLDKFNEIYEEGKSQNDPPVHTNCGCHRY